MWLELLKYFGAHTVFLVLICTNLRPLKCTKSLGSQNGYIITWLEEGHFMRNVAGIVKIFRSTHCLIGADLYQSETTGVHQIACLPGASPLDHNRGHGLPPVPLAWCAKRSGKLSMSPPILKTNRRPCNILPQSSEPATHSDNHGMYDAAD